MKNRQYPDRPIIGVGAIVFEEDRILLIRRGKEPGRGKWSLPGGIVHLGESLEAAFSPLSSLDRLELTPGTGPVILKAYKIKKEIFS